MHLRRLFTIRRLLVVGVSLLAAACTRQPPPPNILFILIDTLRADRLGWYGGGRDLTPFLDTVGDRSTVFWNAYAQSSFTPPSMASLFTSRYPSQHGVRNGNSVLSSLEQTLAETLKAAGYVTGGFIANPVLKASLGYDQGLDAYQVLEPPESVPQPRALFAKPRAEEVNQAALAWLDAQTARAAPVFLYAHYMETHVPYTPPRAFIDRIMGRRGDMRQEWQTYERMLLKEPRLWTHPDADALRVIQDLYDAEVVSIDARLRDLFAELERVGFLRNAIVVITADHGDEHMEHGQIGHGTTLYNEVTHVPLLLQAPGQAERIDVHDNVTLIDVAPTVLELAGLRSPDSFEGNTLSPPASLSLTKRLARPLRGVLGPSAPSRAYSQLLDPPFGFAKSQQLHSEAIVLGSEKLIVSRGGDETYAYDLKTDPGELQPNTLPADDQKTLTRALADASGGARRSAREEQVQELDENAKEQMRALGYGD